MDNHLLYLTGVVTLGIGAQWLAWRARLPAILVLLVVGFIAGQWVDPDTLIGRDLLFSVVSLSVAIILFEGGLSLRIRELRETSRAVFGLVTVGAIVTWILTALAAWILLDFQPSMALLTGAILVVSGPTVIVPLLRHVRPVRKIGSIVKWEGIVNDPIGAVLAVLVFEATKMGGFQEAVLGTLAGMIGAALAGTAIAAVVAFFLVQILQRYWVPDFLRNVVFLAIVIASFTASNYIRAELGLVTVTMLGIFLANQKAAPVKQIVEFKENLRVLLISVLFILLASRLRLSDLTDLGMGGVAFLVVLLLVVRPLTVLVSTIGAGLRWRERIFLGWIAPRGIVAAAVASVFALEMEAAEKLVPIIFLVIVGTVTVYGLTAAPLARWLKIADPNPQGILFAGASPWVQTIAEAVNQQGFHVLLVDTNYRNITTARMKGLPTSWANILSGYAREELDLGGIGRLMAMTSNDVANALAAQQFTEFFGRAEVYQLPLKTTEVERQERVAQDQMGRVLFGQNALYGWLAQRLNSGAVVKTTRLTEEFDYDAFRVLYGDSALVLFAIKETGELVVSTAGKPLSPKPGQTIIALVEPVEPAGAKKG